MTPPSPVKARKDKLPGTMILTAFISVDTFILLYEPKAESR